MPNFRKIFSSLRIQIVASLALNSENNFSHFPLENTYILCISIHIAICFKMVNLPTYYGIISKHVPIRIA